MLARFAHDKMEFSMTFTSLRDPLVVLPERTQSIGTGSESKIKFNQSYPFALRLSQRKRYPHSSLV
jgi:hypothetical protein